MPRSLTAFATALALAATVVSACGGSGDDTEASGASATRVETQVRTEIVTDTVTVTASEEPASDRRYPDEVRATFMENCLRTGGVYDRCACTLDYLEARLTLREFTEVDRAATLGDELPPVVYEALDACA